MKMSLDCVYLNVWILKQKILLTFIHNRGPHLGKQGQPGHQEEPDESGMERGNYDNNIVSLALPTPNPLSKGGVSLRHSRAPPLKVSKPSKSPRPLTGMSKYRVFSGVQTGFCEVSVKRASTVLWSCSWFNYGLRFAEQPSR